MRLLRASQVAEILGVSEQRAYALLREGRIPAVHVGRQVRCAEDALREWVSRGGAPLPGGWRQEPDGAQPTVEAGA